jgi:uncharacterized membrane protein
VATGLLALGGVELHFDHSSFAFLQGAPFLIVLGLLTIALLAIEASPAGARLQTRPAQAVLALASLAVGALFFAGELCRAGDRWWPGIVAGVICAAIGVLAAAPFLARLRKRLDAEAAALGIPLIAEGSALLGAVLSVVAPPLGVVLLLTLLWLIYRGRGRDDQKYAGLRILR